MSITFRCEHCRLEIKAPDGASGKRGKCPHCNQSTYIPVPPSQREALPLAPLDSRGVRAADERDSALIREMLDASDTSDTPAAPADLPPLEHHNGADSSDARGHVVAYCLAMSNSKLKEAAAHARQLRELEPAGLAAVDDFLNGRAFELDLDLVPTPLLKALLKQLREEVD